MHAQIGHQGRRAHVHAALGAELFIEQRLTEPVGADLDHVEARCQRDADHLERPRLARRHRRQLQRLQRQLLVGQQRGFARFHFDQAGCLHAPVPLDDVAVVLRLQVLDLGAGLQHLGREVGLDLAHGDRQQRRIARAVGKALEHAKRRGGELQQRRHGPGADLERKAGSVAGAAAGGVDQAGRQFQRERGGFGQRRREVQVADQRIVRRVFLVELGLVAGAGRFQQHGGCQLARHRAVEAEIQRPDRHAGGLRVFALAAEADGEGLAHLEGPALFHAVGHTGATGRVRCADALAPDDFKL